MSVSKLLPQQVPYDYQQRKEVAVKVRVRYEFKH